MCRAEHELGIEITGDYRAFLLNHNGGTPTLRFTTHQVGPGRPPDECFYSIGLDPVADCRRSLEHHAGRFRSWLPELMNLELWDAGRWQQYLTQNAPRFDAVAEGAFPR